MMQEKVALNSVLYNIEREGQGEALLLLHGFTGSARNWAKITAAFSAHFQVIAPDLLGHGETEVAPLVGRYAIEAAAQDLITLLDRLEIEQTHLLGYSMGGRLALYTAVHYPQRVLSLILESASPGLKTAEERAARRRSDEILAERIEQEGIAAFVDYWEALPLWHSQNQTLSEEARAKLRGERLRQSPQGLAHSLRGMGTGVQPSLWPELPQIRLPVQLIAGEWDRKFVEINQEMLRLLPDARLEIVPQAGHAVHLENPAAFKQVIQDFPGFS